MKAVRLIGTWLAILAAAAVIGITLTGWPW